MTLSFRKVLLATTAFVAVTASAHAAAGIATSTTTALATSDTTGGIQVLGLGSISVTGESAITISNSTAGNNIISVSTGGIIRSYSTSASTISSSQAGATVNNGLITINNSGTIANLGNAAAISLTNGTTTNGVIINNAGTISGSVGTGAGVDTINMTAGTITGVVSTGAGNDVINYTGGTISTLIDGGANTDTFNISGSRVWNVTGDIANFETVNISNTTVNLNSARTFASTNANMNVDSGATLNVSSTASFGLANNSKVYVSGSLVLGTGATLDLDNGASTGTLQLGTNGSVRLGAGGGISTDLYVAPNLGKLTFDVGTSRTAGRLDIGQGAAALGNTSISVVVGSNAGYIASGTQFIIMTDTGANTTTGTLLTTSQGVYRFTIARANGANNDISLTIGRVATASLVESEAGQAIASTLDAIGTSTNSGDIRTIQDTISAQTTSEGVNRVVESLTPAADSGVGMASLNVATQSGNTISTRLASLRGSALSGIATGDRSSAGHVWLQGFGNTTTQDNHNGNAGYTANSGGATAGVDTDTLMDGYNTGMAFTYGRSSVSSKASNDAQTDVDSYLVTLYGSKGLEDGYFVNGQVGAGYNKYKSTRNVIGFGSATKGDWSGQQYSARLEAGRDIAVDDFTVTPLASAQYTMLDQKRYTETGPAALTVNPDNLSAFDIGAGAQVGYNMAMDNGGVIRPRVRAKYNYRAGDTSVQTTSNFVAGGSSFTTQGVSTDRGSLNLGTGILLTSADGVDLSVDYDADIRSSMTGHTGQVKIRWPF